MKIFTKALGLLLIGVSSVVAPDALAHTFNAPSTIEAEPDGSFSYVFTFEAGPGEALVAGYGWDGFENVPNGAHGDCFCDPEICTVEQGEVIVFEVEGWLINPEEDGYLENWFALCGDSDFRIATQVFPSTAAIPADGEGNGLAFTNQPNPMIADTRFQYSLASRAAVDLQVYGVDGTWIATLVSESQDPGEHSVSWSGLGPNGLRVASGIYFARLDAGAQHSTARLIVIE